MSADRSLEKAGEVIASGKTKTITRFGDHRVRVSSNDAITAGDGLRRDTMPNKAELATRTTCNVFTLLECRGVESHFIRRDGVDSFIADEMDMLPLEMVVRRVATGSYVRRCPFVPEGFVFVSPVFELFEKDDAAHDPLLKFDFAEGMLTRYGPGIPSPDGLMSREKIADSRFSRLDDAGYQHIRSKSLRIFEILEAAWRRLGGTLYDFKIEFGYDKAAGRLKLGDVIDADSWRLCFRGERLDKQAYRDDTKPLDQIQDDYARVADLTRWFLP